MNILKRIAPGAVEPVLVEGTNFFVVFAPVEIDIKRSGDEFSTFGQGTGIQNGETFKRLEIRNPSLSDVTVVLWVGGPEYHDARSSVIEPKVSPRTNATTSLAATTGVTLTGVGQDLEIRRKAVLVTNLDAALDIQVRDPAGVVIATVFPRQNQILPISEEVEIYNANGSAVAVNIAELWWSL